MAALPSPFRPTIVPADPVGGEDGEDWRILGESRAGNFSGFDVFVNRHKGALLRFLLARVGAIEAAEDLAQEVFISVLRAPAEGPREARVRTWLFTIARNRVIDHHRAALRREKAHAASLRDGERRSSSIDPATAAALEEEHGRVMGLLGELPEEQREVLSLRIFGGLSLGEIAEVVGVPLNTVKSRTRYALGKIADRLTQEGRR
ncbi:MAG: sigma-70 family RNA polymerase sigma factor [Phycisphaerae bacterium]